MGGDRENTHVFSLLLPFSLRIGSPHGMRNEMSAATSGKRKERSLMGRIPTKLVSQSLQRYTQIGEALRCRELEIEVLENLIADMETDS
jgi:hypothetical protein